MSCDAWLFFRTQSASRTVLLLAKILVNCHFSEPIIYELPELRGIERLVSHIFLDRVYRWIKSSFDSLDLAFDLAFNVLTKSRATSSLLGSFLRKRDR